VAKLAAGFAESFGGAKLAGIAGMYHDLGKGTKAWQAYLRKANQINDDFTRYLDGHPGHATAGAQWLFNHSKEAGKFLAYCIAGHHGGLPNWDDTGRAALKERLVKDFPEIAVKPVVPEFPQSPPVTLEPERLGFQFQFLVRMLFSCLVDADYLDTEAFLDQKRFSQRSLYPDIGELRRRFEQNFAALRRKADPLLKVNIQRERVLADCLAAAEKEPGIFSLTVPTGGGKTLASLAFALEHARKYGKRRIIYVIPFTSIIEQNAAVFRDMLGDDAVLEHHCNFIADESDWRSRLAAENWDAPIIVTTNVQFFNSFYANRTSKCRKLHNVADSIVIFDEVQAIPVEKLRPCLEVIKELTANYGVSAVLCTATQPAIECSDDFPAGLRVNHEIVQDIPALFAALKRTKEEFVGTLSVDEVAARLVEYKQVLCVVNTRQQALDIFKALPNSEENIHLSALMHPAHRTARLAEIRERLAPGNDLPCRVVSTQLIEAGVDVDFPAVFRAVAGIDSIAQAAGRCNRNGVRDMGRVSVFSLPEDSGGGFFRQAVQSAEKLFAAFAGRLTEPDCVRAYFADYFWKNTARMDADGIIEHYCLPAQRGDIQFRDMARFQMIESATIPVIIAVDDEAEGLLAALAQAEFKGGILRRLQKYSVQIYPYQLAEIKDWLESPMPEVWVLRSSELYSRTTGLKCSSPQGTAFFG